MLAQLLRKLRGQQNWKLRQAAAAMHVQLRTYQRYEQGERIPDDTMLMALAQAARTDPGPLIMAARYDRTTRPVVARTPSIPDTPDDDADDARTLDALTRVAEDYMERRGFIGMTTAAGASTAVAPEVAWLLDPAPQARPSTSMVDALMAATEHLRRQADQLPLSMALPPLQSQLKSMTTLLKARQYEPAAGPALLSATSTTARLVGWLHYEAGDTQAARAHMRTALALAHAAGDPCLAAYTLALLSRAEPEHAVMLLRMALKGAAGRFTPVHEAWTHYTLAAAYGEAARPDAALREVDVAQAFAPTNDAPDYLSWVGSSELLGLQGEVYHAAGRYDDAATLLAPTTDDARLPRDRAGFSVSLALVQLDADEPDASVSTAHGVLDIVESLQAPRVLANLDQVLRRLPDTREARELRERRTSLV